MAGLSSEVPVTTDGWSGHLNCKTDGKCLKTALPNDALPPGNVLQCAMAHTDPRAEQKLSTWQLVKGLLSKVSTAYCLPEPSEGPSEAEPSKQLGAVGRRTKLGDVTGAPWAAWPAGGLDDTKVGGTLGHWCSVP